jgi:hypothetical protein
MAGRKPVIYLHVGAMKTGTSYLQQLLADNKEALLAQGILFPGDQPKSEQVAAVRDALRLRVDAEIRDRANGAWPRLRAEMMAHEGRASLVSMEFLSFAARDRAKAVVRSLRGAEVHIILTVRDASRVIPAQWQETTQNRGTTSWPDFVEAIVSGGAAESGAMSDGRSEDNHGASDGKDTLTAWRAFQRAMDVPRMLEAWGATVPPERLHVVLVPAPGSEPQELWMRFASVIGVDPSTCNPPGQQRNASLDYAAADLMRRVNVGVKDLGQQAYGRTVKSYLCKQVLVARSGGSRVSTDRRLSEFALDWNHRMSDAIAQSGAQLVGVPEDLDVKPSHVGQLEPPPDGEVLDAARDAVVGLEKLIKTRSRRLTQADQDAAGPVPARLTAPQVDSAAWESSDAPVEAAVADVVALARHAVDLRAGYRRAEGKPAGDETFQASAQSTGLVSKVLRRIRNR